jgi:hypothetical protein
VTGTISVDFGGGAGGGVCGRVHAAVMATAIATVVPPGNLRVPTRSGTVGGVRALLCFALLAACGPKVAPKATAFDEDLPRERTTAVEEAPPPVDEPRPVAPPGKGLRFGTIERAKLLAVLDGGPGTFLRQLEVTARLEGQRFIGWQLVQLLDKTGPLHDVDVLPGDVLLAVNGKAIARPDQLQSVWDSLRTANELRAQLWRGGAKLELAFVIEPKVQGLPTAPAAPAPMPEPMPEPTSIPPAEPTPSPTPKSSPPPDPMSKTKTNAKAKATR